MRDEHATHTAEMPGIEPLPPKPPKRQKELVRRDLAGYQGPRARPSCRDCQHMVEPVAGTDYRRCLLHGFSVELGATCNDQAAAGPKP